MQEHSGTEPSKFCFGSLSLELQRKIWSELAALPPTRWLSVAPEFDRYAERSPPLTVVTLWCDHRTDDQSALRKAMSVCPQSRDEAQTFNFRWPRMVYLASCRSYGADRDDWCIDSGASMLVNPMKDVFVFGTYSHHHGLQGYGLENAAAKITSVKEAVAFSKVGHLAISFTTFYKAHIPDQRAFVGYMSNFSNLQNLIILVPRNQQRGLNAADKWSEYHDPKTPFSTKASGLVRRWVDRLFQTLNAKMPTIKIFFETKYSGPVTEPLKKNNKRKFDDMEDEEDEEARLETESWDEGWKKDWAIRMKELEDFETSLRGGEALRA